MPIDLKAALCALTGDPNTAPSDYVVVRAGARDIYERMGCTYVGPVEGARGLTGALPMIAMRRAALPTPVPEPIKETTERTEGGFLSKFRRGLGRE